MPAKDGETELTTEEVLGDVDARMDRTLEAFRRDLNQLRTGRAAPLAG